jgi:DNA-binding MarR family transcriptional regulator
MTCTITMSTPVSPEQLRWVLDHAAAMAETIDVDANHREIKVRMADLRLGEPVRPVVARDTVATVDSGSVASDEGPEPEPDDAADAPMWPCPICGRPGHTGYPCAEPDYGEVPDEPPAERTPAPPGFGANADGTTKQAILDHLRDHGPITSPDGRATVLLAEALDWDHHSSAFQRHLKQLADAGLISREMPHPRKTVRIALAGDDVALPVATRDLVLAALEEHGPISDASGCATSRLYELAGSTTTRSWFTGLLGEMAADGAIVRIGSATRTRWIGTPAQALTYNSGDAPEPEPAPEVEAGPSTFRPGSTGWAVLEEIASDGGTFEGGQSDLARAIGRPPSGVGEVAPRLRRAGLIVQEKSGPRRVTAIRLTVAGWAHLGQEPPADEGRAEPEPGPEVEDVPEPEEPPVDWSFMGRTDRADWEAAAAAAGPRPNVLDAVEGPDDKGRPLIDSVEVVEELSDEDLARALGKAAGR